MIRPHLIALVVEQAEAVRLDPVDLFPDDCLDCAGTGQTVNHDFPGVLFECPLCRGTARKEAA